MNNFVFHTNENSIYNFKKNGNENDFWSWVLQVIVELIFVLLVLLTKHKSFHQSRKLYTNIYDFTCFIDMFCKINWCKMFGFFYKYNIGYIYILPVNTLIFLTHKVILSGMVLISISHNLTFSHRLKLCHLFNWNGTER